VDSCPKFVPSSLGEIRGRIKRLGWRFPLPQALHRQPNNGGIGDGRDLRTPIERLAEKDMGCAVGVTFPLCSLTGRERKRVINISLPASLLP
jgi:hypothetical protein